MAPIDTKVNATDISDIARPDKRSNSPSIWNDFQDLLAKDSSATAVLDDRGYILSRADLDRLSERIAIEMRDQGLGAGDVIIICMPNWADWLPTYLAALRLGVIPGTLPITSDPGSIAHVMNLVGAKSLVLPSAYRKRDFISELPLLTRELNRATSIMFSAGDLETRTWKHLEGALPDRPLLPEGLAHILFSSSTTGKSKAIAHSEVSLRAYNEGVIQRYGVDDQQSIFMPSPLGHSTGFWHGARMSLMVGAPLVLQDRWEPNTALNLVQQHNCAITVAATPFLMDLVEAPWEEETPKLEGMRTFLCGGAPIPPSLIEEAQQQMPDTQICSIWAMSEGGATSSLPNDSVERVANTCGTPLNNAQLKVMDATGQFVEPGTQGEIVMKTPSLFLGYIGQPELYEEAFTQDGYFRTGDTGFIDAEGYLHITGRLKDLIIRGGVNISPVEIESALAGHPSISQVAVVGEPDERMGERICAVIQPHGQALTLEELKKWLAARSVPQRLWPESLRIVDALPQTPAGKIQKNILREQLF